MADERRLTSRMTAKWSAFSREGRLPRQQDLDLEAFGADAANCLVIELGPEVAISKLLHVGETLRNAEWSPGVAQPISAYPANSLVRLATAKISAVLTKRGPITFGGTGVRDVTAILYRAILLPLSNEGAVIDHVLGAINFKEISVVEEYSDQPAPPAPNAAESYFAFSSRRVAFSPAAAKRSPQVMIK